MKDFVILTDSCSDLDGGLRKKYGIEYIKMVITHDGSESVVSLDWDAEFGAQEFYDLMRNGKQFKTTQVNMEAYRTAFEQYLSQGMDILSLTTSSGLSGSFNSSIAAKNSLTEKYPDAKIYCIDTLRGSLGQGMQAIKAAEMKADGKSIDETAAWIEANRLCIHQVGTVDDLKYLKRAGRVTGMAAFMSGILNIKPLIISNIKGENQSIAKVKGRKQSFKAIVDYIKKYVVNPQEQTLYMVHADCIGEAEALRDQILQEVAFKAAHINYVGPVIGSTVGPGMLGVYYYGQEVTENQSI